MSIKMSIEKLTQQSIPARSNSLVQRGISFYLVKYRAEPEVSEFLASRVS